MTRSTSSSTSATQAEIGTFPVLVVDSIQTIRADRKVMESVRFNGGFRLVGMTRVDQAAGEPAGTGADLMVEVINRLAAEFPGDPRYAADLATTGRRLAELRAAVAEQGKSGD